MLELAWDGNWYRRAYFDDGTPLGSAQNEECRIDSLTQSWAVFSQDADPRRAARAMEAVRAHLVRRDAQVVLLLTPPFDRTPHDPGYIKGYLPGVRENGGQYTHAALWTVIALAQLGLGDEAMELFHMVNPINHMRTPEGLEQYRAEPYVVAADVYAHPMHLGRGGWTWYTGSAGWMYQAAIEELLGLRRDGATFSVAPCIPAMWPAFSIRWTVGRTRYHISVVNPDHRCRGVRSAELDGVAVDPAAIPLVDDGQSHEVVVQLGDPPGSKGYGEREHRGNRRTMTLHAGHAVVATGGDAARSREESATTADQLRTLARNSGTGLASLTGGRPRAHDGTAGARQTARRRQCHARSPRQSRSLWSSWQVQRRHPCMRSQPGLRSSRPALTSRRRTRPRHSGNPCKAPTSRPRCPRAGEPRRAASTRAMGFTSSV